jgi:hypothetical protein
MARTGQGANIEIIAKVSTILCLFCVQENVLGVMNHHLANTFVCRLQSGIGTKDDRHGDGSCSSVLRLSTPKLTLPVSFLSFSDLISQSRRGGAESGCVA